MKIVFKCDLNGESVLVNASDLNGLISAGPDDLVTYYDSNFWSDKSSYVRQSICKKKELIFLDIEDYRP